MQNALGAYVIETLLLSTHIICFGREIRKIIFRYALLSWGPAKHANLPIMHQVIYDFQTRPTYGSALEKFVYMLCDNSQLRKPWMMSFKTKQYNSFNRRSVIDLDSLSLDGKAK